MERPRRAVRPSEKASALTAAEFGRYSSSLSPVPDDFETVISTEPTTATGRPKRKTREAPRRQMRAEETFIEYVLKNTKSPLTMMDISDLINTSTWAMLSPGSQNALKKLLPPSAFVGFKPTIDANHPSRVHRIINSGHKEEEEEVMLVDNDASRSAPMDVDTEAEIDLAVFTDSHFLAAAHTFQDHIFSGWISDEHAAKVRRYQDGVRHGTLAAPWKDEVWDQENPPLQEEEEMAAEETHGGTVIQPGMNPFHGMKESNARAGPARDVRLNVLSKNNVIRVGDVIAYRRMFTSSNVIIEKDVIIQSIQPKTHAICVLYLSDRHIHLPTELLLPSADLNSTAPLPRPPSIEPAGRRSVPASALASGVEPVPEPALVNILSATIMTPSTLETILLDTDARVEKTRRPNGNAWKCFTVYRWRGDQPMDMMNGKGGRENHGTLFYLRQTYFHERWEGR